MADFLYLYQWKAFRVHYNFFFLIHFSEHVKWSKKARQKKKMFLKTFDDRFLDRQSFDGRFFYEYKKVLVSSQI